MKLCKDCKHYKEGFLSVDIPFAHSCVRKTPVRVSMVTGNTVLLGKSLDCTKEREDHKNTLGICGKEGKFWQPKEQVSSLRKLNTSNESSSMVDKQIETEQVTRVEFIDEKGLRYVKYLVGHQKVKLSFQDNDRTLKIFIDEITN